MHRFVGWIVAILLVSVAACGGESAQQKADTPADTVTAAAPAPPPEVDQAPPSNVEVSEEYVVHGVCPFPCCRYGNWTMLRGGTLRSQPSGGSDSIGAVAPGTVVRTDDGAMVLQPPGIAVVVADTSNKNTSGPAVGDTVQVITYTGAKVGRVRWQGQEIDMNWSALQVTREPLQRWWVHMTDPVTTEEGWLQVEGVNAQEVSAENCRGKQ